MRDDQPSSTALWIAQAIVFWSLDERVAPYLPTGAAEASRWFIEQATGRPAPARISTWTRLASNLVLPGISIHYLMRKRRIEEVARAAIADGVRRIIVLGAGFDTLAYRLHREFASVEFVELDHPATQRVKRAALEKLSAVGANLTFMPRDLGSVALPAFEDPTLWIAEGLFMYLDEAEVRTAFQAMRGGQVAFTFMEKRGGRVAFRRRAWLIDRLVRSRGEPFRWGIAAEAIDPWLNLVGFDLLEIDAPDQLRRRYLPLALDRDLGPADGDLVCVARARSVA